MHTLFIVRALCSKQLRCIVLHAAAPSQLVAKARMEKCLAPEEKDWTIEIVQSIHASKAKGSAWKYDGFLTRGKFTG